MNVGYLVNRVESRIQTISPEKIALKLESNETWTYGDLNRISNQYAHSLQQMGIVKGDRVGILLYNCLEYFALYFAIAKLGAIAVRINFRLSSEEFKYILNDSGTKILCLHSSLQGKIEPIKSSIKVREYVCLENENITSANWTNSWDVLEKGSPSEVIGIDIDKSDPVMLMYTSGTTGRPKGALWSHENTLWFANMQILKWGINEQSIAMSTGPLYHVGAMEDISLSVLMMGGTVILTRSGGFDIERVLSTVEQEKVTDILLFPFMVYNMLNVSDLSIYDFTSLKRIFSGGDPVVPWAIEQLHYLFPHIDFVQVYGLTEGTPVAASLDPQDVKLKGHSVGKPMPFTEIKIVDDQGNVLSYGNVGEVCIKSPSVSMGYWRKPEETASTFVNGWCHTGDLGYLDKDGYLTISGRKKDMIRSGGENIYAVEVEDVLIRHTAIHDVAVIGIPDPKYIEVVCAIIVLKQGEVISEKEILAFIDGKIAGYKKPKQIIFVDELPRTPSGKIQKFILREQFS
ncbi:long-chain fatty acid--CoA ligase [Lysinibacillus sp. fls2-241-R2A-57]|uniref:class I adenylate-forming enzyme family protein n=1 Tax=Lysinibacillus sp. fls2-241-R2A-57 TaxID=3040292 RepID=UPI002557194B|nr:long-chain fatty acid--CoA ligase [Lysinibacillus sp. fls2-241-R2A-57]